MLLKKYLTIAIPLLAISGCAEIDRSVKGLNSSLEKATAPLAKIAKPEMITDTLEKICKSEKENSVRANNFYEGKSLAVSGKITDLKESSFDDGYIAYLDSGKVNIIASTESQSQIKQMSNGQNVRVSGIVTMVSTDVISKRCSILLDDSKFEF